jgi:hypoxanthine phosphoribosyltransferase
MTSPIDVSDRRLHDVDQLQVKETYRSDLDGILLTGGEIHDRVDRLGEEIAASYADREFYPICVLEGAIRFFVDLLRAVDHQDPYREGVVRASRYHGTHIADTPEVDFPDPESIEGRDVLLVEDILDEGRTLETLVERVKDHDPRSVEVATLFVKDKEREPDIDPRFEGFVIPDEFVVGYGLDYDERYRDFPHLGALEQDVYQD